MFNTNNKLIDNISKEFNIETDKAEESIQKLFSQISSSILNKNRFYMYKLGIININDNGDIILLNEDENFDESLESLKVSNNNIKNIFLEKSIYKSIFQNINNILNEEDVYIKDFGNFSSIKNSKTIEFEADDSLKNKVKELNNNDDVVEDILDELDNKIKSKRSNENNSNEDESEEIEEIVENSENSDDENESIDNNIIGNIWKNQTYNSIDLNNMIDNIKETEENKENTNQKEELLDINHFDKEYLESDNTAEIEEMKKAEEAKKIKEEKEDDDNYPEMKEYSKEELLDINHFDKEYLESEDNSKIEKEDNINDDDEYSKKELLDVNHFDKEYLESDNTAEIEEMKKAEEAKKIKEEKEDDDNYPEMKEYSKEELLDINHFDKEYLESEDNYKTDAVKENEESKTDNDYPETKEYSEEKVSDAREYAKTYNISIHEEVEREVYNNLLNQELQNKENTNTNIKKLGNKKMENKKPKRDSTLFVGIIRVILIIIFVLIIGIATSIYYNNKILSNNSIENQKLYDIVNEYFNQIDSANLSYITSKDMYYWDIAKVLYGDATYWPLLYAYNNDQYKISNVIRKGSSISYRNIPDFYSIREIRYLNNTLSKSYIYIYPILTNDNKINHALWALKLSAYYDLNVFKNNSNIMPEETYLEILNNNNTINTAYNDFIKYGQLNENIFISLFESIKQSLGIGK